MRLDEIASNYIRPRSRSRVVKLRTACGCEKTYEAENVDPNTAIRISYGHPDRKFTYREFRYAGEFDREMPVFREVVDPQLEFLEDLKRENLKLKSDYTKLHDSVFGMEAGL